mgnify:CR=1 FL=1
MYRVAIPVQVEYIKLWVRMEGFMAPLTLRSWMALIRAHPDSMVII